MEEDSNFLKSSTTKKIYNITENLEHKLNNRVSFSSKDNSIPSHINNYMNYNIPNKINQNQLNIITYISNRNEQKPPELQIQSQLNEYYIRKIINDEFSSLIVLCQQDLHSNYLNIWNQK